MNQGNSTRILAIDLARGLALVLMILSHGVKGLLSFDQFPSWGLVPVHLITKFSSTIFFMTFGMSLAVSFAPATADPILWPQKRRKLIFRGLTILFWYKILTVIEMSHLHDRDEILAALLYQDFPSYAEILGFYALALLWIPFLLPLWQKSTTLIRAFWPLAFGALALVIAQSWGGALPQLKALLVEDDAFYTWGQLSRAPFVFLGLFIGSFLLHHYSHRGRRRALSAVIAGSALLLFGTFYYLYGPQLQSYFFALAQNNWKHPPEMAFILFSLSGALGVVAFAILLGDKGARWLAPVTSIGKETLTAFVVHLLILFAVYRILLGLWLEVSYFQALALTGLLIVATAAWIQLKNWSKKHEVSKVPHRRSPRPRDLKPRELASH